MKVHGVYDGEKIVLSSPLPLAPNSIVEVIIPDSTAPTAETIYWDMLATHGLIVSRTAGSPSSGSEFAPIQIEGEPLSQTIIDHRR